MPPRSLGSGTISFGLVSIPVKALPGRFVSICQLQFAPCQVRQSDPATALLSGMQRSRGARRPGQRIRVR